MDNKTTNTNLIDLALNQFATYFSTDKVQTFDKDELTTKCFIAKQLLTAHGSLTNDMAVAIDSFSNKSSHSIFDVITVIDNIETALRNKNTKNIAV